jgi:serine/threonine protein kinase/predicted DNA-binding transcriptional regulator AlpA
VALLGGVSEVADKLGVSRQRFTELRGRNDFPQPVAELASGPVWDLGDIDRWLSSGARRRPGRPSSRERVVGERFVLEESALGDGGFAEVYRAVDRRTGEVVAVKILKDIDSLDSEEVIRFRRELRLMKEALDHPHVAKILDHGDFSDTDQIWCAMPLAVGSLADEITQMANNLAEVADLARQLCAGVGHVHDRGILHRDLKPGNILRSPEGIWQVSDFGLAREDDRRSLALTSTLAQGMGTWIYASPEQWRQPKYADQRDDIFAIGKILQHALTGDYPMEGADQMPESALRPVIQRATGPRDNRYPDAASLQRAVGQAMSSYSAAWEEPTDRLARLRPRLAGPVLDQVAADELLQWLLSDDIDAEIDAAGRALMGSSRDTVEYLWATNPNGLRRSWAEITTWMRAERFGFEYCDTLANTTHTIVTVTRDTDILREGVAALARVGEAHNRWHVRDVLTTLLQSIREPERALAALEGLQDVPPVVASWAVTDFAARTMHPVLRNGIQVFRRSAQAS